MLSSEFVTISLTFALVAILGYLITFFLMLKKRRFSWYGYVLMNVTPLTYIGYLSQIYGTQILTLFLVSIVMGFTLEYLLGFIFHKIHKEMLWKYNKYSVHGYTSLLTIPFWGTAGIVFWLLVKSLGM